MTEKHPENFKKINEDRHNDMEYRIQVDHKFANRIDNIVKSLELSNYKVIPDNKKRQ